VDSILLGQPEQTWRPERTRAVAIRGGAARGDEEPEALEA
jgi:hypothetical protein